MNMYISAYAPIEEGYWEKWCMNMDFSISYGIITGSICIPADVVASSYM